MPRWDDPRGSRHDPEQDRWTREPVRERGGERRASGEELRRPEPGRFGGRDDPRGAETWAHDRYVPRYDTLQPTYGRQNQDAGSAGYDPRRHERQDHGGDAENSFTHGGEPYAYAGQEYGMEGGFDSDARAGPGWGLEHDGERRRNFDFDDPGSGQSQAGYGEAAQTHPDQEFDADYLRWREQQLRAHDRDYEAWRLEQHQRYDEQYRQFRGERQRHFGQAFHEWRAQRAAAAARPGDGGSDQGPGPPRSDDRGPPRH